MIRSSLCDYSDTYILVEETITVTNTGIAAASNSINKNVIFKNCASFTDCLSRINNKEIDHAKDINVVMRMYNLIEYSDNYMKTSGSSWHYYRDEPFIVNNRNFVDVPDDLNSVSFKYNQKITGQIGNDGIKDVQIMVPLKYLSV